MSAYMVDRTTNGGQPVLNRSLVDRLPDRASADVRELMKPARVLEIRNLLMNLNAKRCLKLRNERAKGGLPPRCWARRSPRGCKEGKGEEVAAWAEEGEQL